jgi:lipid-A-disaccharide synthase
VKYFLIAGEASGDMHGAGLMRELKLRDQNAVFWFLGGDQMCSVGGTMIRHYRNMAFMGFVNVLINLHKVIQNFRLTKKALRLVKPDVVILIDYPGFNLKISSFVVNKLNVPVYYYIAPKVWAWKTYRIKQLRREISGLLTIFPFETAFFKKHGIDVCYVGNPSVDAIDHFLKNDKRTAYEFSEQYKLSNLPYIALLPGSRKQEIESCLPAMLEAASRMDQFSVVIAGAPGIETEFYASILSGNAGIMPSNDVDVITYDANGAVLKNNNLLSFHRVSAHTLSECMQLKIITGDTYQLVKNAAIAVVNSGTATLETALLNTPQVVVYHVRGGRLAYWLKDRIIKIPYISLVNILMNKNVVKELVAHLMTPDAIANELDSLLNSKHHRNRMLDDYEQLREQLGEPGTAARAAEVIYNALVL